MYNNEKSCVMFGLVCAFALSILSVAVPEVGYMLLGLVVLGIAGLVGLTVGLLWTTRYKPLSDEEIRAHRAARQQGQDVMSR